MINELLVIASKEAVLTERTVIIKQLFVISKVSVVFTFCQVMTDAGNVLNGRHLSRVISSFQCCQAFFKAAIRLLRATSCLPAVSC